MGNYNHAIYQAMRMKRDELFDRAMRIFGQHGARFLGMARGLEWDAGRERFEYVLGQDLEDLDTAREALLVSAGWRRVCLDFTIKGLEIELHFFRGQPPLEHTESVCISYPETFSEQARTERESADRLLGLMSDLGSAIDRPAMVCGSDIENRARSAEDLERVFAAHLAEEVEPDDYRMHTAFFEDSAIDRLAALPGFASLHHKQISPGYEMITLLDPP